MQVETRQRRPRVLHIGPSVRGAHGGMAAVIADFSSSTIVNDVCNQHVYASFVDGGSIKRTLFSAMQLARFALSRRRYDVCHIHMAANASVRRKLTYARIARRQGARVIIELHASAFVRYYRSLPERIQREITEEMRKADVLVALSPYWQRQLSELLGIPGFKTLPNAVDTAQLAHCYRRPEHPRELLALGHLRTAKGTYDLIDAIDIVRAAIPDVRVTLAGGEEVDTARRLVRDKGLQDHVRIPGWVGREEKLGLLEKADIVTLPSHFEALPVSLIEGMAAGKAIVATRVGGIPDLVDDQGGVLVKPQSVEQLAEAIIDLLSDPERVRAMQIHNRDKARDLYSQQAVHTKLVTLYQSLVDGDLREL